MNSELISMLKDHLDKQDKANNFDPIIYKEIKRLSGELDFYVSVRSPNRIDIGDFSQCDFYLALELDKSGLIVSYFVFRSDSFSYDGERTDIHDAQSLLFSLCCATRIASVSLWDVSNGFSEIKEELYARYATISQPNYSVITQDDSGIKNISAILSIYEGFLKFVIPYRSDSSKKKYYSWDIEEIRSKCKVISKALGIDESEVFGNRRLQPDWDYYKAHSKKISIIRAPVAKYLLESSIKNSLESCDALVDDQITYHRNGVLKNCFSLSDFEQINRIAEELTDSKLNIITSESHMIGLAGEWIITKHGDFGLDRFKIERDEFSKKTIEKVNFLFDNSIFNWKSQGSPERFESLCRDLLARESLVSRVRKVSPTNQPDRSRDLIAEIIEYKSTDEVILASDKPLDIKKYFVQCKLTTKTLGIPTGMGPYEALYLGDYNGYLLITNSILSSDHTALLEKLRSDEKYSADWWTKDDIEEKLKNNIDLLFKYEDLVSYSTLTSKSR